MPYLLQALSSWSIAALALGLVVGFVTRETGRPGSLRAWPVIALAVYCIGVAAALLRWLPGRYGLWLETALLLGAAYVIGCLFGCLLQGLFVARPAPRKAALQTATADKKTGTVTSADSALAEGVNVLASHAEALAAAVPAALAASGAAQKLLAEEAPATGGAKAETPVAADSTLAESVNALSGHATALAAAVPAALAASSAAQKLLAEDAPAAAAAKAETPVAADSALEDCVNALTGHAAALAAAVPAALAASGAAQKLFSESAASPASAPPGIERPERGEDEDNLQLIRGIGEKIAGELHDLGVRRFSQIAAWTPEQEQWIAGKLVHCGPVARKYWVAQARLLASGVDTEFSRAIRLGEARNDAQAAPLDEAAAAALHAALPGIIAPHANDEIYAGQRPLSLLQPPHGEKDDLSAIEGIDPATADRLNALGTWTYAQIARWSVDNGRWIGFYLAFPGRVERENWIGQAQARAFGKTASG